MSVPADPVLYKKVKTRIYKRMKKHSAYRSGTLVREYKKAFAQKYGVRKKPYKPGGAKPLKRWFQEKWRNQKGGVGYKSKSDVYRPTKRVSKKTPKTFSELSKATLQKARNRKRKGLRATFK